MLQCYICFLDDPFQPSHMLLVSVLLTIFSSPVHSSQVQSSPAIVDGQLKIFTANLVWCILSAHTQGLDLYKTQFATWTC